MRFNSGGTFPFLKLFQWSQSHLQYMCYEANSGTCVLNMSSRVARKATIVPGP